MTLPKGFGNPKSQRKGDSKDTEEEAKIPNLRDWHPLYFIPIGLGILMFIMRVTSLPFSLLANISFTLCILSFFFVLLASKRTSRARKLPKSPTERLRQDMEKSEEEWDPDESPAVMLGASGVYGIVYGLGITDALGDYAKWLGTIGTRMSSSVPLDWLGILVASLPNTLRLLGFLVTIIPFIHGAVLMFSNRWYYDKKRDEYHFGAAFIYFILAFVHAVLFFFVALNILETSRFLLTLWIIMIINAVWLIAQVMITSRVLKKKNVYFFPPWIAINFNTLAFLTIFVLAPPIVYIGPNNINDSLWLNSIILSVLAGRSVVDYYVGWESLYNRRPIKKPEEIIRLCSYLMDKEPEESDNLRKLHQSVAKKFYDAIGDC
jgi:hypothetical protein